jgi:hypothetical protein
VSKAAQKQPERTLADNVTALRTEPSSALLPEEVMAEILACNDASKAQEDLWSRTRQATDMVSQATAAARKADSEMSEADLEYKTAQAENPERSAPRPRQWLIAAGTLVLDGLACYFAAAVLDGDQLQTLIWAALFLALLGAAELALDHLRDHHRTLWRWIAFVLGSFIVLLGVLRYSFLATVGTAGPVAALAGAVLFTVATAGFVVVGYKALRAAETGSTWKARRRARGYARLAAAAHRRLDRQVAGRDRLARAYLCRIRTRLVRTYSASQLPAMEHAVWAHLLGQELR